MTKTWFYTCCSVLCWVCTACKEPLKTQVSATSFPSLAVALVASTEDPRETHYIKSRTTLRTRAMEYLETTRLLYTHHEVPSRWRSFFAPTHEGEQSALQIAKEISFIGKEGMSIRHYEINDISFDETIKKARVDVFEEQNQRGAVRCVVYTLHWAETNSTFYRTDRTNAHMIPCK